MKEAKNHCADGEAVGVVRLQRPKLLHVGANRMAGALMITRSGLQAAADLQAAALAHDDAAIEKAAAAVSGTCGACHKQYREQLPDNSYEIRL